jgi:uroporphyrinogen decarboxylase
MFLAHIGYQSEPTEENKGRPLVTFSTDSETPNPADYFHYDVQVVEFGDSQHVNDFSSYFTSQELPPGRSRINEWGMGFIKGSQHHFEEIVYPMKTFSSIIELEEYPWPDVTADYRRQVAVERIRAVHAKGLAALGWPPMKGGTFFETAWGLRGFENFMLDMVTNPDFATTLLDKIAAFSISNACFLAKNGADVILTGDDFGMQDRMIISPNMWRTWFKPYYARLFSEIKSTNSDTLIFYHSDGDIQPIIPDLIEIGLDILNPVQPECMDPVAIKQQYGDKLAFWGTLGTQSTLPYGSVKEVKATVKHYIETVGKDGGLLMAPTHKIEPDVPWENVLAFFEAIEEYGTYN